MPQMYLPDVGEGLTEAELAEWLVAPGDVVELNQTVCEIETAKSRVELPSPHAGTVTALAVTEGETVEVGAVLMTIGEAAAEPETQTEAESEPETVAQTAAEPQTEVESEDKVEVLVGYGVSEPARRSAPRAAPSARTETPTTPETGERVKAVPGVRLLAKQLGIDLAAVSAQELGHRVTYLDLVHHTQGSGSSPAATSSAPPAESNEVVRTPIKGVRKATAQAVTGSAFTAPHVTEFVTIDVTELLDLVTRLKASPRFEGLRVTPLLIAARAACVALTELPEANATWDEANQQIVQYPHVNLGIAAATDRGLIVPNIKAADTHGLRELARAMGDLVTTARSGRTTPADMSQGTFTITNVGVFGVEGATPILNPGEAAILALGAVQRRPWVVGDEVLPRSVMTLSLSFDHRLVDGELGSRLLVRIAEILGNPLEQLATS